MGLPRSTYYDAPSRKADDAEIIATMMAICDEFEVYGYRRVGAELRHRDMIVNSKKVRRLMREHDLQPKRRRRFMAAAGAFAARGFSVGPCDILMKSARQMNTSRILPMKRLPPVSGIMIRLPPGSRAIAATAPAISSALLTRAAIGSTGSVGAFGPAH
jgi:hypothetical protein